MVERLWQTVKYEDIYIRDYETVEALVTGRDLLGNFTVPEGHDGIGNAISM